MRQTDKTKFGRAIREGSQICVYFWLLWVHSIDKVATYVAQEEKIMAPTGTRQPAGQIQLFVSVANSEHRARSFAYEESVADSELGQQVEYLWQRPDGLQSLNYLWSWPFQKVSADPCFRSLLPPEQNYHKNLDGNAISILLEWSMRNELYCRRCNCSWCVCVSIHYSPTHRWSIHRSNWAITIKSSYLWYFA